MDHELVVDDAGVVPINQMTYMPSEESPIAFSKDGRVFGYVNQDQEVVVLRTDDGALLHQLAAPVFGGRGDRHQHHDGNEPVAIEFAADGGSVIVAYSGGIARFGCQDTVEPEGHDRLPVHLEGPHQRLRVGEPATFTATHLAGRSVHGHAFFVDGELIAPPSTAREVEWTPQHAGDFTIEVRILDGRDTGSTTLPVRVFAD
jgi:hypothetical protein